ncbi:hypothetical protein MKW92_009846 [Papaver armeniacum]|nr:hypothetical protein MKW92_009846 [Papaver armeniacum]
MAGASNNKPINLVLFGRIGNGKSSLGNSIIRKTALVNGKVASVKAFVAKAAATSVTGECQMETTTLDNGQVVNVIDTPGLFDPKVETETLREEIVKCMALAKEGIHGFLLVFSIKTRFSLEEKYAIDCLRAFFGEAILGYRIIVYTGGDELEEEGMTLKEYLGPSCPDPLKNLFKACNDRIVVFNNRTKDKDAQEAQIQQLMSHVEMVLAMNDGKPYTNEIFQQMLEQARLKPKDPANNLDMQKAYEEKNMELNKMAKFNEVALKMRKIKLNLISNILDLH